MIWALWMFSGLILTVILLGIDDQPHGAFLSLIPGMIMGPFVLGFIFRRWIGNTPGHF